jgi:hypothetical protein
MGELFQHDAVARAPDRTHAHAADRAICQDILRSKPLEKQGSLLMSHDTKQALAVDELQGAARQLLLQRIH